MKYNVIKPISSGSFGTIYEVLLEHEEDGVTSSTSKCVLKELTRLDNLSRERFEREIKILPELNHTNIVNILYWNIGGDPPKFLPYYIMEYLKGGSLRRYMDEKFNTNKSFVFDPTWVISTIILPICNALAQAHSSYVYHRDLKPDNIIFTDDTRSSIKVADWGLVKGDAIDKESLELTAVTSQGQIGGTPGYCSPEQWFAFNKDEIDGRTDIYSLGIIFYEMLTRILPSPYNSNDPYTLEKSRRQLQLPTFQHLSSNQTKVDPPSKFNSNVTSKLDACILKMIEVDPQNRQSSVWDLITDLDMLR
ncbi:MAG TPA: serine/threonine-protein kinase [Nitrososphaeraceae archaeon]|nr:serine/threonine-protein kinase [Nitrososphaeraceae archaeon]